MEYYVKLKEARKKTKLTQMKVSEILGTTQYQIVKYEKGIQDITVKRFKEMCILYQVSADEILELNENKPL